MMLVSEKIGLRTGESPGFWNRSMILLLCPDCLQWREPLDGYCPVCGGRLDLFVPDVSIQELANAIGDWRECLGEVDVSRPLLPTCGQLHATSNGLLFVPYRSAVYVFDEPPRPPSGSWIRRLVASVTRSFSKWPSWLTGGRRVAPFGSTWRRPEPNGRERLTLAESLMNEPGAFFVARASIASWRRQRRRWDFLRPDARWLPERFSPRGRDGDRRLLNWLETTACSLHSTTS